MQDRKKTEDEQSLRGLWYKINSTNINVMTFPEKEVRKRGRKKILKEIMAPNVPSLMENTNLQIQELNESQVG